MRCIYVDRMGDGRISVRIEAGISAPKKEMCDVRDEAIRFVESKVGSKGMVVGTTLMSPEQLAAHKEREVRAAALIEQIQKEAEE